MATLYRKYRPQKFADVAGQTHVVETLENAIRYGKTASAYLFTGERGTGKTTLARLFAKAVNCDNRGESAEPCGTCVHCHAFAEGTSLDVVEIDAASHTGVDNIRELRETVAFPPTIGSKKIYIVDEAHMLSSGAWNALLKTLEEPPAHVVFIFATTELHKIPDTILSRCQRFDFSKLPEPLIVEKLSLIARFEGVEVESDALRMIAAAAEGGMRDAESLFSQVIALEDAHVTTEEVARILGISETKTVRAFAEALADRDMVAAFSAIRLVAEKGYDRRIFADSLIAFFRSLVLLRLETKGKGDADTKDLRLLADRFSFPDLARILDLLHGARKEIRHASVPELPLEIATIAFLAPDGKVSEGSAVPSQNRLVTESGNGKRGSFRQEVSSARKEHGNESEGEVKKAAEELGKKSESPEEMTASEVQSEETKGMKRDQDTPSSSAEAIPFHRVEDKWASFLEEINRTSASLALAFAGSVPREVSGDRLSVSLRHGIHKDKLEKNENRLTAENALATILGAPMRLQFVLQESPTIAQDSIIESALDILGGKVVS